jgi:hypothetical protein
MGQKQDSLSSLKDILAGLFSEGSLPFNPDDARIWRLWEESVGSTVALRARPSWIQNRRLRVLVSDSIWLQELSFMEEGIRANLNRLMGREAVEKIEFRLDLRQRSPLAR